MPKLPDIDYGNSVQSTTQTAAVPYEEASRLAGVMAEGIAAYSQARVKSQMDEAAVTVAEDLAKAEQVLKAKKTLTVKEIKETLGGDVPEHVAEKIADRADDDTVETFDVGDALYAHAAKKSIEAASKRIDGAGWQTDFKERIAGHVQQKKAALASYHLGEMDDYLQAKDLEVADRLVNAGDFDAASQKVVDSVALKGSSKVKALAGIETARQLAPANAALSSTDPTAIRAEVARLQTDERARKAIPEARRMEIVGQLQTRGMAFEAEREAARIESMGRFDAATGTLSPLDEEQQVREVQKLQGPLGAKVSQVLRERAARREEAHKNAQDALYGTLRNAIASRAVWSTTALETQPQFARLDDRRKADIRDYLDSKQNQAARESRARGNHASAREQSRADLEFTTWFARQPATVRLTTDVDAEAARRGASVTAANRAGMLQQATRVALPKMFDQQGFAKDATGWAAAQWPGTSSQAKAKRTAFVDDLRAWHDAEIEAGRPVADKEIRAKAAELLMTVAIPGTIWDTKTTAEEAKRSGAQVFTPLPAEKQKHPLVKDVLGGQGGASPTPPSATPVRVNTPAEALALPKGTRFITPDGKIKVRP